MKRLSNNPPPNPPKKHHYIPAFYLSRWAIQGDGRLCQYSRPHKTVVANRRHPEATGFLERLYELEGLEDDLAQQIESKFFSPVDTCAADALLLMETEGNRAEWDQRRRSAWSRFLHSMLVRAPEDIESFKAGWRRLLFSDKSGEWERRYQEVKGPNDPPTFNEFMLQFPDDDHNRSAMRALTGMIDNPSMGLKMNRMVWAVIDTPSDDHPLLTSDRPIIRTNGMLAPNGHLVVPIGPHKLFVAAKDQAALDVIRSIKPRQLVREANRQTVQFAVKYVYGVDDTHLSYVRKHFATKLQPRLMAQIADRYEEMADELLPAPPKQTTG